MSRPIKFRAWDKRWQKMYDWQYCLDNYTLYWLNSALLDEHVIMQYTNVTDKNGVEVYEGDVIRFKNQYMEAVDVVKWLPSVPGWKLQTRYLDQIEVIGNVHEDPELVEIAT